LSTSPKKTCPFSIFDDAAVAPAVCRLRDGSIAITRVGLGRDGARLDLRAPVADAYYVIFQLRDHPPHAHWTDGQARHAPASPKGSVHILDLNRINEASLEKELDSLNLIIDRAMLDALAEEAGAPRPSALHVPEAWTTPDPMLSRLAPVLTGTLAAGASPGRLFVDQIGIATAMYLAEQYGGLRRAVLRPGGLAPWQERRAKEMIAANLAKEVSLADIAAECGLSPSHFSKAFKASVGVTPHGWLQASRVDQARALLKDGDLLLAEIAIACGFADQSHFNRIFRRAAGITPGAWRRMRRA
jgi:AraC family transcriptional regulator